MNYGKIITCDPANGLGMRVSMFVSGCTRHCKGCFNQETWDFNYGKPFTEETENFILHELAPDYIHGLTVLGGEPMEPSNQKVLLPFLRKVKETLPNKDIWIYSGYTFEELMSADWLRDHAETYPILKLATTLVDGRFIESEKDISLDFRGSRNQRIIDLKYAFESFESKGG